MRTPGSSSTSRTTALPPSGVTPGAVTAFGVINDTAGAVTFVLDAALLEHEVINAHPLINTATTSFGRDELIRFAEATGHKPLILKLSV